MFISSTKGTGVMFYTYVKCLLILHVYILWNSLLCDVSSVATYLEPTLFVECVVKKNINFALFLQ